MPQLGWMDSLQTLFCQEGFRDGLVFERRRFALDGSQHDQSRVYSMHAICMHAPRIQKAQIYFEVVALLLLA